MREEQLLQNIDFSRFSHIRASLWQNLQQKHQMKTFEYEDRELGWDELDQLVAAKGPNLMPDKKKDVW